MFLSKFKLTTQGKLPKPKFSAFAKVEPWSVVQAGQYNSGILTIVDEEFDDSFLKSWSWLIGNKTLLIAVSSWGDFIYACSHEKKFFIVLIDQNQKFALGNSLSAVFDKNLASPEFIEQILRPEEFKKATKDTGSLDYGECYAIENQTGLLCKRKVPLFLEIVGQTGAQLHK